MLRLDEQRIAAIMTPRREMFVVDLDENEETVRQRIVDTEYSRLVVCRDGLDHILGILQTGDLLKKALPGHCITAADVESVLHPPLYVPETVTTTQLLESFRRARLQFALIVDEYGDVQGLVTLTDVLAAIVGELSVPEAPEDRDMVQREDGSWLIDGANASNRFSISTAICLAKRSKVSIRSGASSCTPSDAFHRRPTISGRLVGASRSWTWMGTGSIRFLFPC